MSYRFAIISLIYWLAQIECKAVSSRRDVRTFPSGFLFGASTASYQTEGAWNEDGKTENFWDHITHMKPNPIRDGSDADIANDSYHKYKRDVEIMRELGLDHYRFSLSWARIMPTGFPDQINPAGVQYYNNLIDEMLKYNIQPMVTLFHWDMPQRLQDVGGWSNPYMVDWFADFARVAFQQFGDRVKYWNTINQPQIFCTQTDGIAALMSEIAGVSVYMCGKTMLLAHAKAYHIYDKEFRPSQKGTIFITLNTWWYEPESEEHAVAAEEAHIMQFGFIAHPIFSETGDFPPMMKERIANKSAEQGFFRSRLPEFTAEEISFIRGTSDLLGLNHYRTNMVYRNNSVIGHYPIPSYRDDMGVMAKTRTEIMTTAAGTSKITKSVPWGFYKLLTAIREKYNNPPVFITENGFPTQGGLEDDDRVQYIREYLDALLDAVEEGSDIRGYTVWSLLDCFELVRGYTDRFGLYEVDYSSPERTRTPRKSAFVYKEMIRTRNLDFYYQPNRSKFTTHIAKDPTIIPSHQPNSTVITTHIAKDPTIIPSHQPNSTEFTTHIAKDPTIIPSHQPNSTVITTHIAKDPTIIPSHQPNSTEFTTHIAKDPTIIPSYQPNSTEFTNNIAKDPTIIRSHAVRTSPIVFNYLYIFIFMFWLFYKL